MVITTLQTSAGVDTQPQAVSGAKAAALAINKNGGINGHKLEITSCDDGGTPNGASVCGRNAVSDGVMAVIGISVLSASFAGALQAANIPMVGNQLVSPPDYQTDPTSYPLSTSVQSSYGAQAVELVKQGYTKVGIARWDTPLDLVTVDAVKYAIDKAGGKVVGTTDMPLTATDYASYVTALKNDGATGIVIIAGQNASVGLLRAAAQINYKPKWAAGDLTTEEMEQLKSLDEGEIQAGYTPPANDTSVPGIATFHKQMDDQKATGDSSASKVDTTSLGPWLSVYAIANAMKGASGPTTGATLISQIKKVTTINLFGLMNWSPNKSGPTGQVRVSNGLVYPQVIKNGELVSSGKPPIDMYASGYTKGT